jgi:periplasmic divalent cation tolerance protein
MTDMLLVFSTFASEEEAAGVVRALLDERLAACGTLLPGARSLYRWRGAVADEREVVVLLKTRRPAWPALERRLRELHPYETAECVAVEVAEGSPAYLAWLAESVGPAEAGA